MKTQHKKEKQSKRLLPLQASLSRLKDKFMKSNKYWFFNTESMIVPCTVYPERSEGHSFTSSNSIQ